MQENDTMQDVKRMTLEAVVIHGDGSTEDLGIIAGYDSDPEEMAKLIDSGAGSVRLTERAACE